MPPRSRTISKRSAAFRRRERRSFWPAKGHNAGDALICANTLLDRHPDLGILVLSAFPLADLRPNVRAPFELLRVRADVLDVEENTDLRARLDHFACGRCIDLCIDGLFGMQCRPPLRGAPLSIVEAVNAFPSVRLRAAVDLPSGVADESDPRAFRADFTYATGIAKLPLAENATIDRVGRVRYLDLGFFRPRPDLSPEMCILRRNTLWQLAAFREPLTHKRTYGHLLILAGSDSMPGACLMATMAAANSGVGLVTVGTVKSVARAGTVLQPEAMWTTVKAEEGGLHTGVLDALRPRFEDFSAILLGPGLGRSAAALELARTVVETVEKPLVLDADGLFPGIGECLSRRPSDFPSVVLTPHPGEWQRIGGESFEDNGAGALRRFCRANRAVVVLKGPRTRIADSEKSISPRSAAPSSPAGGRGTCSPE